MPGLGHKRTLESVRVMSALPPKADITNNYHSARTDVMRTEIALLKNAISPIDLLQPPVH